VDPQRKRPFGRSRRGWEDNSKVNLGVIERDMLDWIDIAQNRVQWWALMNTVIKLNVP
jgi:hypothetical protein